MDDPRCVAEGQKAFNRYHDLFLQVRNRRRKLGYGYALLAAGFVGVIAYFVGPPWAGRASGLAAIVALLVGLLICMSAKRDLGASEKILEAAREKLHETFGDKEHGRVTDGNEMEH